MSNKNEKYVHYAGMITGAIGSMFEDEKYNLTIATISFVMLLILILIVILFDHNELRIKDDEINV